MKVLGVLLVVGVMYMTPVWLFDQMVMPELQALQGHYGNTEGWLASVGAR